MNSFSDDELWNLRLAVSDTRMKYMDSYLEALGGETETLTSVRSICESYSELYLKLVSLTTEPK